MQQGYEEFLNSVNIDRFLTPELWNIHSSDLDSKEAVRRQISLDFPDLVENVEYDDPKPPGWSGYTEVPNFGVLAFIGDDGTVVYRW